MKFCQNIFSFLFIFPCTCCFCELPSASKQDQIEFSLNDFAVSGGNYNNNDMKRLNNKYRDFGDSFGLFAGPLYQLQNLHKQQGFATCISSFFLSVFDTFEVLPQEDVICDPTC